jgi:hypothetical protein
MKAYSVDQLEQFEKDNATANLLAGSSGICPKCGNGVTMNGGCDHMTCTPFKKRSRGFLFTSANSRSQVVAAQNGITRLQEPSLDEL